MSRIAAHGPGLLNCSLVIVSKNRDNEIETVQYSAYRARSLETRLGSPPFCGAKTGTEAKAPVAAAEGPAQSHFVCRSCRG